MKKLLKIAVLLGLLIAGLIAQGNSGLLVRVIMRSRKVSIDENYIRKRMWVKPRYSPIIGAASAREINFALRKRHLGKASLMSRYGRYPK